MHSRPAARYAVIGSGWRSGFYLRLAELAPDHFSALGVVTADTGRAAVIRRETGVPTYDTVSALIERHRPEFVVTAVARDANPAIVEDLVTLGIPVLSETPPAVDANRLRALWSRVGHRELVQVAEQYLFQPGHAARLELLASGVLGAVTSVQLSSTHGYHAVSLLRSYLGTGRDPVTVTARRFQAPLVKGPDKRGWPTNVELVDAAETVAILDCGGRLGLYDFTEGQWWHPLRKPRLVIRCTSGEIVDDEVLRLLDIRTPTQSAISRRQTGLHGNLEGFSLDTLTYGDTVLYRNPFPGARLSDEEIAVATSVQRMTQWVRDEGPPPYPLADACHDQLVALAIEEAVATGGTVTTGSGELWDSAAR